VQSPNYPQNYGPAQSCTLEVDLQQARPIVVESFNTEEYFDTLTVNEVAYSGYSGPSGVTPWQNIYWCSDGTIETSGWRLCATPSPPAPPTPGPTPDPTPSPTEATETVAVSLVVVNVDFAKLNYEHDINLEFLNAIKESLSAVALVEFSDVSVTLHSGSVLALCTVTGREGSTWEMLSVAMTSGTLASSVAAAIGNVQHIEVVSEGTPTVEDISIRLIGRGEGEGSASDSGTPVWLVLAVVAAGCVCVCSVARVVYSSHRKASTITPSEHKSSFPVDASQRVCDVQIVEGVAIENYEGPVIQAVVVGVARQDGTVSYAGDEDDEGNENV